MRYELDFYIPDLRNFHSQRRENIKSYLTLVLNLHALTLPNLYLHNMSTAVDVVFLADDRLILYFWLMTGT
jgi:hypothetical protein